MLRRTFSLIPEYLVSASDPRAVDLMDYGVPLGRRFRALKLWMVMRSYGHEGLAAAVREHVRMARWFAGQVQADARFEVVAPVHFSVVNFRYKGSDEENRRILECVNSGGEVFLSSTVLNGKFTLHLAVGNYQTSDRHVSKAWELVLRGQAKACPTKA